MEYDTPEFHQLADEIAQYLKRKKIKDIVDLQKNISLRTVSKNRKLQKTMSYYVKHKFYFEDSSHEKLKLLQDLLSEYFDGMEIKMDTVYDDDGEPKDVLCLSDECWNCGSGTTWYTFETNVAEISLAFNEKYQGDIIYAYTKSEDGFEETYSFKDGEYDSVIVTHYRQELRKICNELNAEKNKAYTELYKVYMIAGHPTVRFHDGAYTMINWNYFELFGNYFSGGYSTMPPDAMHHPSRNYSSLEDRSRAMKLLFDYIVQHRSEF